ncbi:hypothetical protein L798_02413 [Zootermopsis nevadensis]|uniref:Uncharacterized protein n=1 Tax=Zootermopsis nevadensis TaxID=136037 RepID=A0A067QUW5_ZOONE|nr:hypothetical protein L798_02413 [Zootermopsis nevadensis]
MWLNASLNLTKREAPCGSHGNESVLKNLYGGRSLYIFTDSSALAACAICGRADRLWGPPSLLSNGYCGPFPEEKRGRGVMLTTSPPSSAKVKKELGLYLHSLQRSIWCVAGQFYFFTLS